VRILLDECLPRQLKRELPGHEVRTVPEAGWASIKNGALLPLVAANYDVFITIDQRLEREHSLPPGLAIITLVARTNGLASLLPLAPAIRDAISQIAPGDRVRIGHR
jgi:hypothetical protein